MHRQCLRFAVPRMLRAPDFHARHVVEALAQRLRRVVLHGRGAELRCIETQPAGKGEVQRTLLAGAALAAGDTADGAALAALCTGDHGG